MLAILTPNIVSICLCIFFSHSCLILQVVDTSWSPLRIGVYAKHLERWLNYFPLSQFLFVSGERLITEPAAEMTRVQDFLGLKRLISDKHFYFNATKGFPCLLKTEDSPAPHCLGIFLHFFHNLIFLLRILIHFKDPNEVIIRF